MILLATTIRLFKASSGTTLLTFDTEVHSRRKPSVRVPFFTLSFVQREQIRFCVVINRAKSKTYDFLLANTTVMSNSISLS